MTDSAAAIRQDRARILIVDDEEPIRDILADWLQSSGYDAATAANGIEATAIAKRMALDVVVTDLRMPGLSGLQLLSFLKQIAPHVEVIFLTGQGTMEDSIEALREGRAFDFLVKPLHDLGRLNLAIEKALLRVQANRAGSEAAAPPSPTRSNLSERELQIVGLLAQGLENREIGEKLVISDKTVKNHLARIYDKLKVANRTQAVALCQKHGWI